MVECWSNRINVVEEWGADDENLRFDGDARSDNCGARIPFNGTIVYVSAVSSGGVSTKGFDVCVRNGNATTSTIPFNLVANVFSNTTYNVNFNAGNYLNVFCQNAGNDVEDPAVIVWVKWPR